MSDRLPPPSEPNSSDTLVYESIKKAILDHRLPPGTKLTEERLSTLFGVSRERIRKILQRLAYDKCVDLKPNRGAFVAEPSIRDAREVFAARILVETHLIELVAKNADPGAFSLLRTNIEGEKAAHDKGLVNDAIALSGEFHLLLADASGNRVLAEILRDLVARSSLILAMYGRGTLSLCGYEDHRELLDRILEGQVSKAKKIMSAHLEEVEGRLRFDEGLNHDVDLAEVFR